MEFHNNLYQKYSRYTSAFNRFDKHSTLLKILKTYRFETEKIGVSVENRSINLIKLGKGNTKVLVWTQMHGDEDTATGAVLDILSFFSKSDEFDSVKKTILNKLTLYIIPMLNPDGAEVYERKNALGVDINRDAARQISPESKLLQQAFDRIKPDFAFNMHDQESYYTANDKTPATISLLAPPADNGNNISATREKAIAVVCELEKMLQEYIPNGIGKWSDDYEPRAFGEHFQTLEASTILIESGGYYKDTERKFVRKLNFVSLLHIFQNLAQNKTMKADINHYNSIPLNKKGMMFDMILHNVLLSKQGYDFVCDIGLRLQNPHLPMLKVEEIGDLSPFAGYVEHDLGRTPLNIDILNKFQIAKPQYDF